MSGYVVRHSWLSLANECLHAENTPVVVILGPQGAGKTAALDALAGDLRAKPASPLVRLHLEAAPGMSVQSCVDVMARGFGMRLPCTVYARIAGSSDNQEELDRRFRDMGTLPQDLDRLWQGFCEAVSGFGYPASVVGAMLRPLLGLIKGQLAKRLRKVGSRWLAERLADSDELALSRAQPRLADQILCEALLEDLSTAVSEHLLARNPAVLIDGAQTELGRELLNALVAAKAHRAAQERGDPLVVIAGASSWVELGGKWRRERVVQASEASLAGWRAHANGSRWYPVLLDQVKPDPSALYRLTGGHLAAVVEFSGHHGPALRAHLAATRRLDQLEPEHLPDDLVAWAAAPDVERAEEALLGSPQRAGAIRRELGTRLWLATRGDRTVIRAWPRRLLLNRLARDGARWDEAHAKLEGERGDLYHVLARVRPGDPEGLLDRVVTELDRAFEDPEKHRWILDLDRITAAPNRLPLDQPADRLRESLVKDLPIRTRVDVIRSLVVSKWFRGDPLLDPGRDLEIRELYHELANLAGSGSGDLRDEGYGYG